MSRRQALALTTAGCSALPAVLLPRSADAGLFGGDATSSRRALKELLVAEVNATALDYRTCVRLLFNDASCGGRNGSVHFPEELARPENAGLAAAVTALAAAKHRVDSAGLSASPLSWTDVVSWAAYARTKATFNAIVYNRAAPGKGDTLLRAYGNDFPEPPLGGVDGNGPGPRSMVPPDGVAAGVDAWMAAFAAIGLGRLDFAYLGPDVIPGEPADVEAMMRQDSQLKALLDKFEIQKALLTRTPYEIPYARSFLKLCCVGLVTNSKA